MFKFFNKGFKKIAKKFNKLSSWTKCLVIVIIILLTTLVTKNPQIENFSSIKKFVSKTNNQIYDKFYAEVYDEMIFDNTKTQYEVTEIMSQTNAQDSDLLLDIGSGTGKHVDVFNKKGLKAEGADKSLAMVEYARKQFPKYKFHHSDATSSMDFNHNKFTHISCLYFTIYYIKNKSKFFSNCYDWLKPGGFLIIHLVNRNKFDPILNAADPLQMVSAQKYAKRRITSSYVRFFDMDYKADFKLDTKNDIAVFVEKFVKDNGETRYNEHKLHMPSQKYILSIAKSKGFNLFKKIDLVNIQYEYQYLYILQKPE